MNAGDKSFVGIVLGGIATVSIIYVLLKYSSNTGSIITHSAQSAADVSKTFQGS